MQEENQEEVTFKDSPGLPARQAELARAKADKVTKKKNAKKKFKFFYTEQDGKILKITAKPNGAYSEYVAKKPKAGKENYDVKIQQYESIKSKFKKEDAWVSADQYEDTIKKLIAAA